MPNNFLNIETDKGKEVKMTDLLGKTETKTISKPNTKNIENKETKKIGMSETRAKKIKHSYNVKDAENSLLLRTKYGDVVIEMLPDVAPNHVARIKELVREGFYNGLKFHRVIEGFMAQGGCPRGDGTGGSGRKLKAEFNRVPHKRGVVSMARSMMPDSADSQFFICYGDCPWLDGQYTVWGNVVSGMEYIDMLKKGRESDGMVSNPDIIVSISVISDI